MIWAAESGRRDPQRLSGFVASTLLVLLVVVVVGTDSRPVAAVPPTTGSSIVAETFQNATVPDPSWTAQGAACLTGASAAPPAGSAQIPVCTGFAAGQPQPPPGVVPGYLQLTRAITNSAGSVLYNRPIPASAGVSMSFRQYQYGGTGADGIRVFFVGGPPHPPKTGGNRGRP